MVYLTKSSSPQERPQRTSCRNVTESLSGSADVRPGPTQAQNLPATNVTAGTYTLRVVAAGGSPQVYPATYTLSVTHP